MKRVTVAVVLVLAGSLAYAQRGRDTTPQSPLQDIRIQRTHFGSACTTGELWLNGKFVAHTLELPWRNNHSYVSSIPYGEYGAFLRLDKPDGWRIELRDVPNRANVQIHVGNWPTQIQGCVLVGRTVNNGNCSLGESNLAHEMLKREFYGLNPVVSPFKSIRVRVSYGIGPTEFRHSRGAFAKQELVWKETHQAGPQYTFYFKEMDRDLSFIYAHDASRNMWLRLPLHGGMSSISSSRGGPWNAAYQVSRQN